MTTPRYRLAAVLPLTVLAATLVACAPSPATPAPGASSSLSASPGIEGTWRSGEELSDVAQVEAARAAGYGIYVTTDARQLVVDPAAPLPEVVQQDVLGALEVLSSPDTSDEEGARKYMALMGATDAINATGKHAVLIVPVMVTDDDATVQWLNVVVTEAPGFATEREQDGQFDDPQDARAFVDERLGELPDAARYAVVDATQ